MANNVYKIATRWGYDGRSVYKVFIDNNIVFVGTDNNEKLINIITGVKKDDYFVITNGYKIMAIAKCISEPLPIKNMFPNPDSIIDNNNKEYYADHVLAARVKIEVLRKDEKDEIVCPEEYKKAGRFFKIPDGKKFIEQFNILYKGENKFDIDAGVFTLSKSNKNNFLIKSDVYYSIPVYQRPYAWKQEQIENFFQSIFDCHKANEPLFAGTIQLSGVFEEDGKSYRDVIDGQQRLTTILILLKIFEIRFNNETLLKDFHLSTKVTKDQQEYLVELLNTKDIPVSDNTHNIYLRNMLLINQMIDAEAEEDLFKIDEFIEYVLKSLYFVVIETKAGISKTLQIFNTINTSGLKIDEGEIFKIKLFEYLKNKNPNNQTDDQINKDISDLYDKVDNLNKEKDLNVSFNSVLRLYQDYILAKTKKLNSSNYDLGTIKFFEMYFDEKNGLSKTEKFISHNFSIEEFQKIIDAYFKQIEINEEINDKDIDCFFYNKLFGFTYPSYHKYKRTLKLLLLNFENVNSDDESIKSYKTYLERLTKYLAIYTLKFHKSVKEVHKNMLNVIESLVDSNFEEVCKKLKSDIDEEVLSKQIFDNDHWKKIMCYTSAFLFEKDKDVKTVEDLKNHLFSLKGKNKNYDIEHIYPQDDSKYSDNDKIPAEKKKIINSIGNLVLLEYDINRGIGNVIFKSKTEKYKKSKISEVQDIAKNNEKWDLNSIEERKKDRVEKIKLFLNN